MPKYTVTIEKKLTSTGTVEVSAKDPQAAVRAVREQINKGTLKEVTWNPPEYMDDSLVCYGEVY